MATEGQAAGAGQTLEGGSLIDEILAETKMTPGDEGYEIAKIEELTTESETSYMLQLTSEKSMIVVRMFSNGNSYQLRKDKRKVNSLK